VDVFDLAQREGQTKINFAVPRLDEMPFRAH
jgi:hypothetical protein